MKIIFAGPTLRGIALDGYRNLEFRQPAKRGDLIRAVRDGASIIGLIDGVFELQPSVWHKEILFAISEGVAVLGAASMGALRAAECHAFGMIGVGQVFQAYVGGEAQDDGDVAQLHGPKELGYLPLSEPLVNVIATLRELRTSGHIDQQEHDGLAATARALFFKDRTYRRIVENADLSNARRADLSAILKANSVNVKKQDAILLLQMIESEGASSIFDFCQPQWYLSRTRSLDELLQNDRDSQYNHMEKRPVTLM
ncbi:MAG: antibiotic resistance protein [Rhizobium sp.]|nr:antibiotic resistance protein [Rhizobium sp.]